MKKNMQIEGLRGVACLMIVLFHIFYQYDVFVLEQEGFFLLKHWGEFGVGIFIFISGFFLIDFEGGDFSLARFYRKRLLRLWPAYIVTVTLIFALRSITYVRNFETVTAVDWLLNLTFINGFIGTPYIEPAHWYMTTLLRSIFLAGILQRFRLQKHTEVFGGLLCLIVGVKVVQRITNNVAINTLCEIILTITGGAYTGVFVLAYMMRKLSAQPKRIRALIKENFKELIVIALSIVYLIGLPGWIYTLLILCAGASVFLCVQEKLPFLNNRCLIFVSKISFMWYLIHQYIAYWIIQSLTSQGMTFALAALAAFAGTGLLAVILYNCVERPFAKTRKALSSVRESE